MRDGELVTGVEIGERNYSPRITILSRAYDPRQGRLGGQPYWSVTDGPDDTMGAAEVLLTVESLWPPQDFDSRVLTSFGASSTNRDIAGAETTFARISCRKR